MEMKDKDEPKSTDALSIDPDYIGELWVDTEKFRGKLTVDKNAIGTSGGGPTGLHVPKRRKPICGIPCELSAEASRDAVAFVLKQISNKCPEDFRRLRQRVRLIRPVSQALFEDNKQGVWRQDASKTTGQYREVSEGCFEFHSSSRCSFKGIVEIAEVGWVIPGHEPLPVTPSMLAAISAHEFGHACSLQRHIKTRSAPQSRQHWGQEAAADMHAFKWGFEGLLRSELKDKRTIDNHGLWPGEAIDIDGYTYVMMGDFSYFKMPSSKEARDNEFPQ